MKIKIKTNLWSGIVMGLLSIAMLAVLPTQVRVPCAPAKILKEL